MILAIDVGNTNLALALGDDGGLIQARWRIETADITSADTCGAALRDALGPALEAVDDAVIASVVPLVTPRLAEAIQTLTGLPPLIVGGPDVDLGIAVNIA